jgi:hypothetical protein
MLQTTDKPKGEHEIARARMQFDRRVEQIEPTPMPGRPYLR